MGLGEDGLTFVAEEIVGSLPGDGLACRDEDLGVISFPVVGLEIVEVVALVHAGESPVETCLVFVMTGAEFGEVTFSIRSDDGVKVWAGGRAGDLSKNGFRSGLAVDGDSSGVLVSFEAKLVSGHKRGCGGQQEEREKSGHCFLI